MWDVIKDILGAITPPKNPTPERQRRWAFAVVGLLLTMTTWTVANTVIMFGLVPSLMGGGFARANDLPSLAQKKDLETIQRSLNEFAQSIKVAQISTLGQQIYNLHVMECNARKAGNAEAASSHAQKVDELRFSYRQLTGYDYLLRPCAEL